jgi:hypothetical protein
MTTIDIMKDLKPQIEKIISEMPFSNIHLSTLGGENHASILFVIGLDAKETWKNGIFENSRYMRFHIERNFKGLILECFTSSIKLKFRKVTTSPEKILIKVQEFVNQLKEMI